MFIIEEKIISSSSSHDCILLEDTNLNNANTEKNFQGENALLKITPNMKVFALFDRTRHIWKHATLDKIKSNHFVIKVTKLEGFENLFCSVDYNFQ